LDSQDLSVDQFTPFLDWCEKFQSELDVFFNQVSDCVPEEAENLFQKKYEKYLTE
jgi:hypothetical protein